MLQEPPPRRLLAGVPSAPLHLPSKGSVRVYDAVLLAVALDLGDAAIPCLALDWISRPLA